MNINNQTCCGCGGCINICPQQCINMEKSIEGFWVAKATEKDCLDCGVCVEACTMNYKAANTNRPISSFAAYSEIDQIRNNSTSGGVFSHLSYVVLRLNGVVYGAIYNEKLLVEHHRVEKEEELYKLRGSKYLQSESWKVFNEVKKDLVDGRIVLFSGTPCQIKSLYTFLNGHPENLLTVDLICHGTPSPKLFQGYKEFLEKKYQSKIIDYSFRNKDKANDIISYTTKISMIKNDKLKNIYIDGDEDPYTLNFLNNKLQNKSCFKCPFATLDRMGDLTLGDYWGHQYAHPELRDIQGVSLVLVNSEQGMTFMNKVEQINLVRTNETLYKERNKHLFYPPSMNLDRDYLYNRFIQNGFDYKFYNKYFLPKRYYVFLLKRFLKGLLKNEKNRYTDIS